MCAMQQRILDAPVSCRASYENKLVLWVAAGGKSFFITIAALLGNSGAACCHASVIVVIAPLQAQIIEQVSKANALFSRAGSTATAVELSGDNQHKHIGILDRLELHGDIRLVYSASLMA